MTVSYKKSRAGGAAYYTNCMTPGGEKSVDDYYSGSAKEPPGVWYVGPDASGSRACLLGIEDRLAFNLIEGREDVERFHNLTNGFHPEDGYALVQNAGHAERIALHDFTMSAPKSVSTVWSQADTDLKSPIEAAQSDSARTFLDFMSTHSITRTGKGGIHKWSAAMRGALFNHGSSREDDPQLHTHSVMINVVEHSNNKTGALETREMMRWIGAAASLYHADLAWRMHNLGFGIKRKDKLFEIAGVPDDVMKAFSQRREQIVRAVEKRQVELGMTPDAAAASRGLMAMVAIESRDAKNELTREQLQAQWTRRGAALGFTTEEVNALIDTNSAVQNLAEDEIYKNAIQAVDEMTEISAVFAEPALITAVSTYLVGRASPKQIQKAVSELKTRHLLVARSEIEADDRFTTRKMLALEQRMVHLAMRPDAGHALAVFELPGSLNSEQQDATYKACTDHNGVTVIEGAVGVGKTCTMSAIGSAYKAQGYTVTGLASSWTPACNLKESADLEDGRAVTGWINGVRDGSIPLKNKNLIILDVTDMVGSQDMKNVLELAKEHDAKVILLGDTLQQKSVFLGNPLRVIVNRIGTIRIDTIRQQHSAEQRQSVEKFFAGQAADGLKSYIASSSIHIKRDEQQTHALMVKRWSVARSANSDKQHLMLATDRISIAELNRLAHEARKQAGEIISGISVENIDCTRAGQTVEFSVDDEVQLRKNDKNQLIHNRTQGTIVQIENRVLTIKTKTDFVDVSVDDNKWQDRKSGKLALQHAYAMTIYIGQGLTVDHVFVKDGINLDRSAAGFAMSRHRNSCEVFVDAQAKHEARMRVTSADEWKPLSAYTDSECIADIATSWSREREKVSTLDYSNWTTPAGGAVDIELQAKIEAMRSSVSQVKAEIERIRQKSEHGMPLLLLPFQHQPTYLLPEPEQSQEAIEAGVEALIKEGVHEDSINEAFKVGMLIFVDQGASVFCGRRSDGGLANTVIERDGSSAGPQTNQPQLRDRFAPVLKGADDRVDVVRTGLEALHLRSLQLRQGAPRSTIVVSHGREDRLGLPHIRELLEKAQHIERHDQREAKSGIGSPIIKDNQQLAQEQAHIDQGQPLRESARHR